MSKQIKITFDDATADDVRRCAAYRFGDGPLAMTEYAKLATVQLMRRDLAMASKGTKIGKDTGDE